MRLFVLSLVLNVCLLAYSQIDESIKNIDTTSVELSNNKAIEFHEITTKSDSTSNKKNIWQKFIGYFDDSNKIKKNKKFDFSIIGGPHYSTDTQFGLGLVGAGLFRLDRNDSILPPSNVSLFSDVSTVGFYLVGIRGTTIFPKDRFRLNYTLYLYSFPSLYWGIGYENGNNNDNKTSMKRFQSKIKTEFLVRLGRNLYLGPVLSWDYVKGYEMDRPELLNGMDLITRNYGFGLTLSYDSRNVLTNASKGLYLYLNQMFRPKWLANDYAFSTTDIRASYYHSVWKGGVLAGEFKALLNFGNPSWAMMANLGDSNSMRGYYEGRYRDKSMMTAQIELRQHVWRRNGFAVWAALGTVFHDKASFGNFLPNYGFGYRWEFKKNVNVRLDLGFGKSGQYGFIFNINEAF